MIFEHLGEFDLEEIRKLIKINEFKILDFGCGTGIWSKKDIKKEFVKKIILYDTNKNLHKILKDKYTDKKITINFDLNKILKNNSYNLVIMSSVIQYINLNDLKKIINDFYENFNERKNNQYIIITDIPKFPRFIELLLLPLFNIKRFFFVIKYLMNKEYRKIIYYYHKDDDFISFKKKFIITKFRNLNSLKLLRYTLILELKK